MNTDRNTVSRSMGAGATSARAVREPVLYGHDLDAALAIVRGFQSTSAALASLNDDEAAGAVERLRRPLAARYTNERVLVPAGSASAGATLGAPAQRRRDARVAGAGELGDLGSEYECGIA